MKHVIIPIIFLVGLILASAGLYYSYLHTNVDAEEFPGIRSEVFGTVASGTIYTTMINLNQLDANLPSSPPYILKLSATGDIVSAIPVADTAIDHRPHSDGTRTIGRFTGTLFNKSGEYQWFGSEGQQLGVFEIKNASSTDVHGIARLTNGNFIIPSYKLHEIDGRQVESYLIEEQTPTGEVVMVWDSIDHIELGEADFDEVRPDWVQSQVHDYFHGNSVAETSNGNLLVSGRHTNSIVKINRTTGEVVWRLGGVRSDFQFIDDPLGGFSHQHSVHELPGGNILLYDNGNQHNPPQTRIVEYALDMQAMTARLVWSHTSDRFTYATGSVQPLPNGNLLIGWGLEEVMSSTTPRISEVTPAGDVVLNIYFPEHAGFYNAFKY